MDLANKKNKSTIYHVNLPKSCHKRPECINLLIQDNQEEIEEDASVPYQVTDTATFDFSDLIKESDL